MSQQYSRDQELFLPWSSQQLLLWPLHQSYAMNLSLNVLVAAAAWHARETAERPAQHSYGCSDVALYNLSCNRQKLIHHGQ